jgi:hypothetical protein
MFAMIMGILRGRLQAKPQGRCATDSRVRLDPIRDDDEKEP